MKKLVVFILAITAFTISGRMALNKLPTAAVVVEQEEILSPSGGSSELKYPEIIPQFIDVPKKTNRIKEDSLYADIINHTRKPYLRHDRDTNAHETTHQINAEIRNKRGGNVNGFYLGDNQGAIIQEPNIRKKMIIEFIPKNLRSYRYPTYVTGQREWDDQPLYIFDEWVAYVNGARVSLQDYEAERKVERVDAVSACIGFSIYAVALAMTVEKYDPEYWKNNEQFRNFLIWHLKRSQEAFERGRDNPNFKWSAQERLLQELLSSSEGLPMRKFLDEHLDGVWLNSASPVSFDSRYETIPKRFVPPEAKK